MKLIKEQMFEPVEIMPGDKLEARYTHHGEEVASIIYPPEPRTVNCMRVYEADDFKGMQKSVILVLGFKDNE